MNGYIYVLQFISIVIVQIFNLNATGIILYLEVK